MGGVFRGEGDLFIQQYTCYVTDKCWKLNDNGVGDGQNGTIEFYSKADFDTKCDKVYRITPQGAKPYAESETYDEYDQKMKECLGETSDEDSITTKPFYEQWKPVLYHPSMYDLEFGTRTFP